MRFDFKAVIATGISVWLAVLACLMGCTLPNLASADAVNASSVHQSSSERNSMDLMEGMENCPHHHFDGSAPAKRRQARARREYAVLSGGSYCCSEAGHRQARNCAPA